MFVILNFFYFLLLIILFIFAGNQILRFLKLRFESFLENSLFSLTFSLAIFSLLSYFSLILNLSVLVTPIFWLFAALGFLNFFNMVYAKKSLPQIKFDFGTVFLTLILAFIMVSITARSGWQSKDGLEFIGVNANDGMWHLSLIGELKNHFPPQHPNFF